MHTLKELLLAVSLYSRRGNRKELSHTLRVLKDNRRSFFAESIREDMTAEFSDALYKMLLLELDEEEEESIEIAELAYLCITQAIGKEREIIESYKQRLLLVHYFCDYFTDSIIEVFLQKYRTDNLLQARSLAIECLEKMQWGDMLRLEEYSPDFIENDEQLIDACNSMDSMSTLPDSERENALLLHQVLYAYLINKYKN